MSMPLALGACWYPAPTRDPELNMGLSLHAQPPAEQFYRMGFNDREIVALLCGGHVYGRCHPTASGYAGPWVEHPTQFSNEYATDMIEDEWRLVDHSDTWLDAQGAAELRPAPGKRQFVNQKPHVASDDSNQMMLASDMILACGASARSDAPRDSRLAPILGEWLAPCQCVRLLPDCCQFTRLLPDCQVDARYAARSLPCCQVG